MARSTKEWIGKTDDAMPTVACKRRIVRRQDGKCAITGKPFTAKEKPEFDHIVPLWLGGKNCESNLQAILGEPHKRKTSAEATVRAKIDANLSKNLGLRTAKSRPLRSAPFPKSEKAASRKPKPSQPPRQIYAEQTR